MSDLVILSVGIPAFNNASTIGETIASLKAQSFSNWECFVTDDSRDEATYLAAELAIAGDTRFTLIKNPQRLGAAGNWNQTLNLANGKYFKLLCADDLLAPDALALQAAALDAHPGAVVCTGRRSIINSSGRVVIKQRGLSTNNLPIDNQQAVKRFISAGTNIFGEPSFALFRTKTLVDAGGFSSQWNYLIDAISYLEVLKTGSLIALDANLGSFRISSDSWSSRLAKAQRKELIASINYAAGLNYARVSGIEVFIGKVKATLKTAARRIVFAAT
jgi:glycosyltransferase involved in cell wall biosynthesis